MGERICTVDGCARTEECRGMCGRHYNNLRKYGHAVAVRDWPLGMRIEAIGWDVTAEGCWEWRGSRNYYGYGTFSAHRLGHVKSRAHRVVYEHIVGPIPEGKVLLHSCDNPPCVNPEHLRPGTRPENSADMVAKDRRLEWEQRGMHCRNGHDLTRSGATRVIKHGAKGERICVTCDRIRKAEWMRKKRASRSRVESS